MIKNNRFLKLMLAGCTMLMFSVHANAQNITITASIDSTQMWIGQQTNLHFVVSQQPGLHVQNPFFSDVIIKGIEMVSAVKMDTTKTPDGILLVKQSYLVTAFDDSLFLIPPFPFVLNDDTVWSNPVSLKVIQPFVIDTAQLAIADIKDVLKPRFSLKYFLKKVLPWILIVGLIVALVLLILRYLKSRPDKVVVAPEKLLPAHIVALSQLDIIKAKKMWQQNRHKEYHTELTDVLRDYLERIYELQAKEMTSDEILSHLNFLRQQNKPAFEDLQQILRLADLIKFAKWNVGPDEHEKSLNKAYEFVNLTKVEEKEEDDVS